MATRLADASQQAAANAVVDRLDSGGAGTLQIYTGAQPADADAAPTGTLLASIALPLPAYGNANTSGVAQLSSALTGDGVAAGTAGWFRMISGGGAVVVAGKVTDPAGDGELKLDNLVIAVDQIINIATLPYTQPA